MALNIPNVPSHLDALLGGINTGSTLFSRIMNPIIAREQMAQQQNRLNQLNEQFNQELQFKKAHDQRMADQFAKSFGLQSEMQPLQKMLLNAQAQQAQANAQKANMWSQLLGGAGMPSEMPQEMSQEMPPFQGIQRQTSVSPRGTPLETVINQGNPRLRNLDALAGLQGIPNVQTHFDNNGNVITRYPSGRVTSTRVGQTQSELERNRQFAISDAKLADELTKGVPQTSALSKSYGRLNELLGSDKWRKMQENIAAKYGTDYGRKASLMAYRNLGSKEEKDLIGRVSNLSNDIVAKSASIFKGPFRVTEQSLIERMKPSENDPVDVALGKLSEMQKSVKFQHYINTRVPTLIRSGLNGQEAFEQAMKESGADKFVNQIEGKYLVNKSNSGDIDFSKMSDDELRKIAGGK